jgi:cobaltochelatase CobN
LANLHAFLSDTLLLTGIGFDAPAQLPAWGRLPRPGDDTADAPLAEGAAPRPMVAVLFYRAQHAAENTAYVHALADAIDAAGGHGVPIFVTSLREAPPDLLDHLAGYDTLITTVLAAGGTRPATAGAGEDDEAWDVQALAALDVPIIQGLCLTWSREDWQNSDDGMSPLDTATQVAVPEFDGRIITVPFSFKENDADGLPHYVPDPQRCARLAGIAVAHARLRHVPPAHRRIAVVLSAYPTKHSRIGNAVGLDTPVSTIRLLRAMREAGYDVGTALPGLDPLPPVPDETPDTTAGNALIHALIEAGGQDADWLTGDQLSEQTVRISAGTYQRWFDRLPDTLQHQMLDAWGPPPGTVFVDHSRHPDGDIVTAASSCNRPGVSGRTQSPSTTTPTCRSATTTWPPTAGSRRSSARTPSCTSANTATSNGCRARAWRCRRGAAPTPRSVTCR